MILARLVLAALMLAQQQTDSASIRQQYAKHVLRIPMRDGTRLFTIAYVPRDASSARAYPILLQRTPFSIGPYDANLYPATLGPDDFMLRDGYIFVSQEVRGRYQSEGTFENVRPLIADAPRSTSRATDEATDAYDTIEWLLTHVAGNNGRVGLFGISYGGFYAAQAELSRHPAIAASSLQAPVTDFFLEDFHHNGALMQGHFYSYPIFGTPRGAPTATHWWLPAFQRVTAQGMNDDYQFQLDIGTLANVSARFYGDDTWWRAIVAHPNYDDFWRARSFVPRLRGITHPVLVVGGWFDAENLYGTFAAYRALRTLSPAADVTLAMGPFGHRGWTERDVVHTVHGNLYFGDSLEVQFQRDVEAAFFRRHLKGDEADAPRGSLVFDTGKKTWLRVDAWPIRSATRRPFYLHPDGTLDNARPTSNTAFAEYVSDPRKPVPSRCSGPTIEDGALVHFMSDDQRCFSTRPDVLTFRTDVLRSDITFAGPLRALIELSTSGSDADVVVKLIDAYPPDEPNNPWQRDTTVRLGGYQQLVRGEIMRARFRESFTTPLPLVPGKVASIDFGLPDVFHTFRKGHRIMVQVQGSWFPLFDRNPQRFVPSIYGAKESDFVPARQRVWMRRSNASLIEAGVLP
ncbi:MAG: CocE/NonD family hydrolase [Gemmatimonadaceae bacterium]